MDVDGLHNHLLAAEEGIADEFAGAQRDGLLAVCHGCELENSVSRCVEVGRVGQMYRSIRGDGRDWCCWMGSRSR